MKLNLFTFLPVLVASLTVSSCVAQKNNNSRPYYHEDLYGYRPKYQEPVDTFRRDPFIKKVDFVPTRNVNAQVNLVLDSINRFNVTKKLVDGFTIQIYAGQKREDAMNAKKKMATEIPELTAELEYEQPKFRVRVGSYFSRLEAQKDLLHLKRYFPNAILVPEKITAR